MSTITKASRPAGKFRRPRTYDQGRRCATRGCETVISRYNHAEHCYSHRPVSFPRLRGVIVES